MNEKLCIFCRHCQWEHSRAMGSTWTGEYGTSGFDCAKGHFSAYGEGEDRSFDDIDDVRALFKKAETCPDYSPPTPDELA